jgi:hypothetical protein
VNTVMNIQIPWKAVYFLTSWATVTLSRRTLLHGVSYLHLNFFPSEDGAIFHRDNFNKRRPIHFSACLVVHLNSHPFKGANMMILLSVMILFGI